MSFADCIGAAGGEHPEHQSRAARAQEIYNELVRRYERNHTRDAAEALAAQDTRALLQREAGQKRHEYLAQLTAMRRIEGIVQRAEGLRGLDKRVLERAEDHPDQIDNVWSRAQAIERYVQHRLNELARHHSRDILGRTRNKAGLENVARELHGQGTGDAAASAIASSVRDLFEDLRLRFNAAGGSIGKLDNWGLPHSHNARALERAGFDAWFDEIYDKLAWHKIDDFVLGRPFAEEGALPDRAVARVFLSEIYEGIVSDGITRRPVVYGQPSGQRLVNRYNHHRVLHFRDADAWINYNQNFGTGDVFGAIMAHTSRMSRDIAQIEILGPNPRMGLKYLRDSAAKQASERGNLAEARAISNDRHADLMLDLITGTLNQPKPGTGRWYEQESIARFFSSTRHILSAAQLDRAVIASISDTNTMRLAAQTMGIDQSALFARHVDLMARNMAREDAARGGWVADTLFNAGSTTARFMQEIAAPEFAERLSSGVIRAQGLAHWTDQARIAFQMEMSGLFAKNAGRSIDQIDEPLQTLLRRRGVTEADWKLFTDPGSLYTTTNGATFASPIYWRQNTDLEPTEADRIFSVMQSIIEEQTEVAVPSGNIESRAFIASAGRPGSVAGEVARSGLAYKSFVMTFTINQYRRIAAMQSWWHGTSGALLGVGSRWRYIAELVAGATVMGAIANQLIHLSSGRDPEAMDTADFWARAAFKGGGLGIIGDVVSTGQTSWGGGFGSYLVGPVPQAAQDVYKLTVGNAIEIASGDETNFGKEFSRFGSRYMPGQQLPFLGPAMDRLVWDQLQVLIDPDGAADLRRASRAAENRYGVEEWWGRGDAVPERAPRLGGG